MVAQHMDTTPQAAVMAGSQTLGPRRCSTRLLGICGGGGGGHVRACAFVRV